MRKPADGSREAESVVVLDTRAYLKAVTADGAFALVDYARVAAAGGRARWSKLALVANAKPETLVATPFDDFAGAWSPDRRWLAYQSDESGRSRGLRARHVQRRGPLAGLDDRRRRAELVA